jgi:transcription initiation factor TFIID subunit 6
MKTLLVALVSPDKARGTRDGAVRGLAGVGKEAVRRGLVDAGGARVVGSELMPGEEGGLGDAVIDALKMLHPPSSNPTPVDPSSDLYTRLQEVMGDYFSDRLAGDHEWAEGILGDA